MPRSSTCRPMAAASNARRRSRTTAGSGQYCRGWKRIGRLSGTVRNSSASNLKKPLSDGVRAGCCTTNGPAPRNGAISELRKSPARTHWLARQAGDLRTSPYPRRPVAASARSMPLVEGLRRGEGGAHLSCGDAASKPGLAPLQVARRLRRSDRRFPSRPSARPAEPRGIFFGRAPRRAPPRVA